MKTSLKLYEISGQYLKLANELASMDLDATTIADTIEASGITDDFAAKAHGVEMVCREMTKDIPAIDDEIERLQALKKRRQRLADGLHEYLLYHMEKTGIEKIETPLFSIGIQKNPPSVEIYDEKQIPAGFLVMKPTISKTLIKQALKTGDVPGARMVQTNRIQIK